MSLLKKIMGGSNERTVKRLWKKYVDRINQLEEQMQSLTLEEMREKTEEFKERLQNGATWEDIIHEAFALVREAARRTTGMRPFDVQVLGGVVLHQGRVAEMKTGEGKTLAATMPAYLNALSGKGVHIVTVNDYLAKRDSEWMGPVYSTLGLEVGVIMHGMSQKERRKNYRADIVYGTNNEFGFDYLRDKMVLEKSEMVQGELNYAIIDEVDSILIDEARTPLIISSQVETSLDYSRWTDTVENLIRKQRRQVNEVIEEGQKKWEEGEIEEAGELLLLARRGYPKNKKLLKLLKEPGIEKQVERTKHRLMNEKQLNLLDEELYFSIDEATRVVNISQQGYHELVKGEPELVKFLGFDREEDGEFSEEDYHEEGFPEEQDEEKEIEEETGKKQEEGHSAEEYLHAIHQLLKAYSLFEKDVDYVVQDGKAVIVDEFTGRLMWGRRYSDGLHQAIEAKENVKVQPESRTVATITFQNYFRLYDKTSGMTGTAATEEEEFQNIYKMDVVVVPTNEPMIREDLPDCIYKTERAKFKAVVEEIKERHQRGQPLLVGTVSVEKSEMLSKMLKRQNIPHNVLNAVNHEREAEIIAQAGRKGAVTISTNMAGRGTDIVLGGNPEYMAREKLEKELQREYGTEVTPEIWEENKERLNTLIEEMRKQTDREHQEVVELGGLHVIGTERHESRRIDNQLRGRSGRQGDPGSSQFYISLEDDLMRMFGGSNISSVMDKLGVDEDQPIDHPMISRSIENAQKKVETRHFEVRKNILQYDDVLNRQRKKIYEERRKVLEGENIKESVMTMVDRVIQRSLQYYLGDKSYWEEKELKSLIKYGERYFLRPGKVKPEDLLEYEPEGMEKVLQEEARAFYQVREEEMGEEVMRELERVVLLRTVDEYWVEHIDAMQELRQEVNTQAFGQQDPLVVYRREASNMFESMIQQIESEVVRRVYRVKVTAPPERKSVVSRPTELKPEGTTGQAHASSGTATARGEQAEEGQKNEPARSTKVGRNEPCPCGSGKKYKKCCGA